MNLKEALDYRRICPFCQRPTQLFVAYNSHIQVCSDKNGLRIQFRYQRGKVASFGHDGTYQRAKRYKATPHGPIQILVKCPKCKCKPHESSLDRFANSAPHSALQYYQFSSAVENLRENGSAFTFVITGNDSGKYDLYPERDIIRYCNDEGFYHWSSDFPQETTILQHAGMSDSLEDLFTLHLPLAKLPNLCSKETFLHKFKTYILFS